MSETVCEDCGTAIHPSRFKCWPCWQKQTGREIPEYAKAEAELHERRLPSSQPEKVEPRVGQTWKAKSSGTEWVIAHVDYVHKRVRDAFNRWDLDFGTLNTCCMLVECPSTLISTGEAEKRTGLLDVGAATLTISAELNEQLARELNENREREVNRAMVAHNDAFHEKEKARILADYEAQRKEPAYQPHWTRTGAVSTYSRRVPRP